MTNIYNEVISELLLSFKDFNDGIDIDFTKVMDMKTIVPDIEGRMKAVLGIDDVMTSEGKKTLDECEIIVDRTGEPNITVSLALSSSTSFRVTDGNTVSVINTMPSISDTYADKWIILGINSNGNLTTQVADKLKYLCPYNVKEHDNVDFTGVIDTSIPIGLIYVPTVGEATVFNFTTGFFQNRDLIHHNKYIYNDADYSHKAESIYNNKSDQAETNFEDSVTNTNQQELNDYLSKRKHTVIATDFTEFKKAIENYKKIYHSDINCLNNNILYNASVTTTGETPNVIQNVNLTISFANDILLASKIKDSTIVINTSINPKIKKVKSIKNSSISLGGTQSVFELSDNFILDTVDIIDSGKLFAYYSGNDNIKVFVRDCTGIIRIENTGTGDITLVSDDSCEIIFSGNGTSSIRKSDISLIEKQESTNDLTADDKFLIARPGSGVKSITASNFISNAVFGSAGITGTMPTLTTASDGSTVDLTECNVYLFINDKYEGKLKEFKVPAITGLTTVDNSVNYVYIDYNGGNPAFKITQNRSTINESNTVPAYTLYRRGTTILNLPWSHLGDGLLNRMHRRLADVERWTRRSGILLSADSVSNSMTISSGSAYTGANILNYTKVVSGPNKIGDWENCLYTPNVNPNLEGTWALNPISTYNSTQYNKNNAFVNLGVDWTNRGHWVVNWIYRSMTGDIVCQIIGYGDHRSLAEAQLEPEPEHIPDLIKSHGFLAGRVIVGKDKSGDALQAIAENPFKTVFAANNVGRHNDLKGIDNKDISNTGTYHVTEKVADTLEKDGYVKKDNNLGTNIKVNSLDLQINTNGLKYNDGTKDLLDINTDGDIKAYKNLYESTSYTDDTPIALEDKYMPKGMYWLNSIDFDSFKSDVTTLYKYYHNGIRITHDIEVNEQYSITKDITIVGVRRFYTSMGNSVTFANNANISVGSISGTFISTGNSDSNRNISIKDTLVIDKTTITNANVFLTNIDLGNDLTLNVKSNNIIKIDSCYSRNTSKLNIVLDSTTVGNSKLTIIEDGSMPINLTNIGNLDIVWKRSTDTIIDKQEEDAAGQRLDNDYFLIKRRDPNTGFEHLRKIAAKWVAATPSNDLISIEDPTYPDSLKPFSLSGAKLLNKSKENKSYKDVSDINKNGSPLVNKTATIEDVIKYMNVDYSAIITCNFTEGVSKAGLPTTDDGILFITKDGENVNLQFNVVKLGKVNEIYFRTGKGDATQFYNNWSKVFMEGADFVHKDGTVGGIPVETNYLGTINKFVLDNVGLKSGNTPNKLEIGSEGDLLATNNGEQIFALGVGVGGQIGTNTFGSKGFIGSFKLNTGSPLASDTGQFILCQSSENSRRWSIGNSFNQGKDFVIVNGANDVFKFSDAALNDNVVFEGKDITARGIHGFTALGNFNFAKGNTFGDININKGGSTTAITAYHFYNGKGANYVPLHAEDFLLSSDMRLKENIIPLDPHASNIKAYNFNFKKDKDKKLRAGYMAQEVEKTHPQYVKEANGEKTVNYTSIHTEKIAELEAKIERLEKLILNRG